MFSRAILVKTWKQIFCTNKVKIPVCKNIINAYKAIPLQAWTGPEGSRRLRLPDFNTFGT